MGGNRASNKQIKVGVNDIVAGDNIDVVDSNGSITVSTDSDMSKSTYDPTAKNSDSFDMDNMDEGTNTKILTSSERAEIATNTTKISYTDSADVAANTAKVGISTTQASDITSNNSKISYTDAAVVSTNASDIDTLELNNTGTNTGDQDISGISTNAGNISTNEGNINNNAIDINTLETNNTGVNTGDQDLSSLATKANVLELDNTTSFTPNADYEPATKKYVDDSTSDVTKIIGGNGITVSPGNGLGDVTINLDGSTGDYTEWATYIGTRAGQDLVVTIGDYDSAGNGTSIKVNDALQKIIASKLIQAENGIESDANNGVILNNLANDGKVTFKASNISSGDDINLEVQDVSGVIALISDISGIAINAGDIATNAGDILALQANNTGVNTGDQDVSGIAINASAINTLETNNTGVNTGDQDISGIAVNAGDISTLETNNTGVNTGDQDISGIAVNASAINTLEINNTGVNTGDQDVSGFAEKTNVLELDNTDIFVPTTDYMPATKKYVDDSNGVASIVAGDGINVSDSGGNVTINNDNVEWSSFTGTQSGGSIDLFIGDYDNQGEGTTIQLDDGNNTVYITGLTHLNGNVTIENNSTLDFNDGTYNSKIQSGSNSSDATLTLPIITGTIALTSDIAAVISDDAYDSDWNGVTNIAPSQNAVYDKMEQFLTSSNLQETLDSGSSAIGVDGNTTVDISIEGASAFSFEKTDASNDINYGVDSNSIYSSLFNQLNDSLSSVLAINGEVQLVTSNVADGQSKTILNIPTAATDGFEFQVNVPRPTLVADTEITMPISINNNFADANGNLNIAVEGGVQTIIAGAGIEISPPGGIGNVIITSTVVGTTPVTNKGDLYTYDTDVAALAVGTNNQVLTVDLSEPTGLKWADASGGSSVLTTQGDILHFTTEDARLGIGTSSQVLTVNAGGTDVEWKDINVPDLKEILDATSYTWSDDFYSQIQLGLQDGGARFEYISGDSSGDDMSHIMDNTQWQAKLDSSGTKTAMTLSDQGLRLTNGTIGGNNTSLWLAHSGSVADVDIFVKAPSTATANANYYVPLSVNGTYADTDGNITIATGDSTLTTDGDMLTYYGSTNSETRIPIGTFGQILKVSNDGSTNSGNDFVKWVTPPSGASDFDSVIKAGNYAYSDDYMSSVTFALTDNSPYTEIALESYSSGNKSKIYSDEDGIELSLSSFSWSTDHSISIDYEGPRLTAGIRGTGNASTSLIMSTPGFVADVDILLLAPSYSVANDNYQIPLSVNGVFCDGDGDITIAAGSSPLTTKGDLYTYSTGDARLAIGTNDYVLTADSTAATGMAWKAASTASVQSVTAKDRHVNLDVTDPSNPIIQNPYGYSPYVGSGDDFSRSIRIGDAQGDYNYTWINVNDISKVFHVYMPGGHMYLQTGTVPGAEARLGTNLLTSYKYFEFPNLGGTIPVSVNGNTADDDGDITLVGTTAPASATDTGSTGEIRVTSTYTYTCIATDTWVRSVAATW